MSHILALNPGTELVGDFRIERVLGVGGFGITYLAHHHRLDKRFAIKEYFPGDFSYRQGTSVRPTGAGNSTYHWGLDRFLAEARAVARFKHPAIVDVIDIFEANDTAYIVLAFEAGSSVREWARRLGRPVSQAELDAIAGPLLDALELIHGQKLLHRDIAPDNLLLRPDGSPVLIDFGSAREDLRAASRAMSVIVKRGYSPPEQYTSNALHQGPWTDIYAVAATLYMLIAGNKPPDATDRLLVDVMAPLNAVAKTTYRRGFIAGVEHGLVLKASDRPQSVAVWRAELFQDAVPKLEQPRPARPDLSALDVPDDGAGAEPRGRDGAPALVRSGLAGAAAGVIAGVMASVALSSIIDPSCFADTCMVRYTMPMAILGAFSGAAIAVLTAGPRAPRGEE